MQAIKLFLFFSIIFCISNSFALTKHAIIVGGSCEFGKLDRTPEISAIKLPQFMSSNLAHRPMTRLASGLKNRGYKVNVNYASSPETDCGPVCNKGKCSAKTKNTMDKKTWSLACVKKDGNINTAIEENTIENFVKDIDATAESINRSKDKSQVLISFVSHGMPKGYNSVGAPKSGLKSHGICFSKPGGGFEYIEVDDPRIKGALDKLKKSKAKIGILDNTCYGGETTKLLSDYGCVMSSQTDGNPSTAGMGIVNTVNKQLEKDEAFSLSDTFLANHTISDFHMKFGDDDFGYSSNINNFPTMSGFNDPLRDFITDFNYGVPSSEVILKKETKYGDVKYSYSCKDLSNHYSGALGALLNLDVEEFVDLKLIKKEFKSITGDRPQKVKSLVKDIICDLKEYGDQNVASKFLAKRINDITNLLTKDSFYFMEPQLDRMSKKIPKRELQLMKKTLKMMVGNYGGGPNKLLMSRHTYVETFNKRNLKSQRKAFAIYMSEKKDKGLKNISKRNMMKVYDEYVQDIQKQVSTSPKMKPQIQEGFKLRSEMIAKKKKLDKFTSMSQSRRSEIRAKVRALRLYSVLYAKKKGTLNKDCSDFKI